MNYKRHSSNGVIFLRFTFGLWIALLLSQPQISLFASFLVGCFMTPLVSSATVILHADRPRNFPIYDSTVKLFCLSFVLYSFVLLSNYLALPFIFRIIFIGLVGWAAFRQDFKEPFKSLLSNMNLIPEEKEDKSTPAIAYHKACKLIAGALLLSAFVFMALTSLTAIHYLISTTLNSSIGVSYLQSLQPAFNPIFRFLSITRAPLYAHRYSAFRTLTGLCVLSSVATPLDIHRKKAENNPENGVNPEANVAAAV